MAGYAGRKKPAEGVALDLFAKALAIEDPRGTRVVIVTMDLISVSRALRDWLEGQVQQKYGLGRSSLLINVSHTHCGPVVGRPMLSDTPVVSEKATPVERYIAQLQTKLVALVGDALGRLAPAKLDFLRGRAGFAMNRRRPTVQGYSNAPNYHGRTLALAVEAALQTVPRPLGGPLRVDFSDVPLALTPPPPLDPNSSRHENRPAGHGQACRRQAGHGEVAQARGTARQSAPRHSSGHCHGGSERPASHAQFGHVLNCEMTDGQAVMDFTRRPSGPARL
jgi:hypothetical protein